MKSALIVLALGRASAFVALAPRVRYTAAAAAHGPSPIMRAPPVEEFLPDASVLDPYAAAGAGGDIDILLNAAIFLIALAITSRLVSSSLDDEIGDSTPSNEGVSGFTWLHADMRMPLPSWDELQTACHMVGTHNGRYMYLCASRCAAQYGGPINRPFRPPAASNSDSHTHQRPPSSCTNSAEQGGTCGRIPYALSLATQRDGRARREKWRGSRRLPGLGGLLQVLRGQDGLRVRRRDGRRAARRTQLRRGWLPRVVLDCLHAAPCERVRGGGSRCTLLVHALRTLASHGKSMSCAARERRGQTGTWAPKPPPSRLCSRFCSQFVMCLRPRECRPAVLLCQIVLFCVCLWRKVGKIASHGSATRYTTPAASQ